MSSNLNLEARDVGNRDLPGGGSRDPGGTQVIVRGGDARRRPGLHAALEHVQTPLLDGPRVDGPPARVRVDPILGELV